VTRVIVCADDYGIAPGVSEAICELIDLGRLSATSCMSVSPYFRQGARALARRLGPVEIGLHLTLTGQVPLGPMPRLTSGGRLPSLGRILGLAYSGRIDPGEISAELQRQVDTFMQALGRPPDFLDGHQHVHVLPGIREVVFDALGTLLPPKAWVRSCRLPASLRHLGRSPNWRAALLDRMSRRLDALARARDVPVNDGFLGIYRYGPDVDYARILDSFLARVTDRTLLMCHPGRVDDVLRAADPLTDGRAVEFALLAGDALPALLARHGVRVAGLRDPT